MNPTMKNDMIRTVTGLALADTGFKKLCDELIRFSTARTDLPNEPTIYGFVAKKVGNRFVLECLFGRPDDEALETSAKFLLIDGVRFAYTIENVKHAYTAYLPIFVDQMSTDEASNVTNLLELMSLMFVNLDADGKPATETNFCFNSSYLLESKQTHVGPHCASGVTQTGTLRAVSFAVFDVS